MGQLSPGFFFGVYCSVNNRLLFSYLDSIFSTFLVSFWAWAEREAIRGSLHLSSVGGAARTDSTHLEGGTVSSSSRRYPVPTEGNPNFPHDFDKEEGESGMGGIGSGRQWCWFTGNLTTISFTCWSKVPLCSCSTSEPRRSPLKPFQGVGPPYLPSETALEGHSEAFQAQDHIPLVRRE